MSGGVTYDAGALIAAERGARELWALHRRLLERGIRPTVPTVALAQTWRGGPQRHLARLLRGCRVASFAERDARAAGEALGRSRTSDVVDAGVVIAAVVREDAIVTSDPRDLKVVADAIGARPRLHVV
jgi:hypothetical protein